MTLETECLTVLAEDLGPSARAFLARQCRNHLGKDPSALEAADIEDLANWCAIGIQQILGAQIAEKIKQGLLSLK
jgi:hypothetical protein